MDASLDGANMVAKLEGFRRSDAAREELIEVLLTLLNAIPIQNDDGNDCDQCLLASFTELRRAYKDNLTDFENERQSRRVWQDKFERAEQELTMGRVCD